MERYIKQIVDDVMEMAAKIQFLEAKVAAAESWNAEQLADAQATVEALQRERDEAIEAASLPTWVCNGCGRVSSEGWINRVIDSFEGTDYEMECPTCGVRAIEEDCASDLVRERDDLQAALDAEREKVKGLHEATKVICGHCCESMEIPSKAALQSQLTQRTAELEAANGSIEAARRVNNDLQAKLERVRADNKALDKWRADVTMSLQRPEGAFFVDVPQHIKDLVAELERVKQALCDADERANEYQKALHDFESERALPLSIELERVRGERDHAKKMEAVQKEVADNQTWHVQQLRTLIAALPKVEGEIEVSSGVYNFILLKHDSGTRFLCGQIETEQTAKAYAALLQHRQGMEG